MYRNGDDSVGMLWIMDSMAMELNMAGQGVVTFVHRKRSLWSIMRMRG